MNFLKIGTIIVLAGLSNLAWSGAKIISLKGDVQIRRGLEETWQIAGTGIRLEDIDSILSGETGQATLELKDGRIFRIGPNTILDIGDLRSITEQELFLFLTAEKIQKLKTPDRETPVQIQNVSTVRAEEKSSAEKESRSLPESNWKKETNAALAMVEQAYHPNAVMKLYQILDRYTTDVRKDRLYFYLGRTFEALNEKGRALEAYQSAIHQADEDSDRLMIAEANQAIQRLKQP